MKTVRIVNTPCLASESVSEVKDYIKELLSNKIGGYSVAINAEKVVMYNRMNSVRDIIEDSILPTIDGGGVSWGLKKNYGLNTTKVDLPVTILELSNELNLRFFLLGSTEEYNKLAFDNIAKKYPGINLIGRHNGYFENFEFIKNKLVEAKPDIIMLALGSPKQEILAKDLYPYLNESIIICAGGAINVQAGVKKRPPEFIINNKYIPLEWLYILITNPSLNRFKRQSSLPIFVFYVIREFIKIRLFRVNRNK